MLIGVLGGGQLGRMLGLAGLPLGLRFRFLDPSAEAPARDVGELVVGSYEDPSALGRFARGLDVATLEFENVPASAVRWLAERVPTFPGANALEVGQDRLNEKRLFERLGLGVHPYAAASTREEFDAAVARVGLPCVVKTRRMGYDGKGQAVARTPADAERAWAALGKQPLLVEAFVPFEREASIVACRGRGGEFVAYPLVQNTHKAGILRTTVAPAPGMDAATQGLAERHARAVMDDLGYVGVLAIEFFVTRAPGGGVALLANEMAPRVHNSGHWTIEGAMTSQFENHVRAVAGWGLGSCAVRGAGAVMHNLIGGMPRAGEALAIPGVHLHDYAKEAKPGRKVGHLTVVGDEPAGLAEGARRAGEMAERMYRGA